MDISTQTYDFTEYLAVYMLVYSDKLKTDLVLKDDTHIVGFYTSDGKLKYEEHISVEEQSQSYGVHVKTIEITGTEPNVIKTTLTEHSIPVKELSVDKQTISVITALLQANSDKIQNALSNKEVHW